jgi:hypothetical protein
MTTDITIFTSTIGINNLVDSTRIEFDGKGLIGLEVASNVYVDDNGLLKTVPDSSVEISGAFHSLYPVDSGFYVVNDRTSDSVIYYVTLSSGQFTFQNVVTGLSKGVKVSFAKLGDRVYYTNGTNRGYIVNTTRYAWPYNIWTGREDLSQMVTPPVGTHIDVLSGRILLSYGDELIFTEPYLVGLYNSIRGWRRFESDLLMVRTVENGTYVSDETATYFLAGNNPNEWILRKVLSYPAIEYGSNPLLINPRNFGLETEQNSLLFNTTKGLCIGLPDGNVINLTEQRYTPSVDCATLTVFEESLAFMSGSSSGIIVQGKAGNPGGKAVTEWYGGFDSLLATENGELVGANSSGLSLIWGAATAITSGLEMLSSLEMLTDLEMVSS